MPLPERLQPAKVNRQKLKQLADMAEEILAQIDNGAKEEDTGLKMLIDSWNSQVINPYAFSDFRDFSSWTSAKDFTRMAFNQEKYVADLSWDELIQIIQFVCQAEGKESEQSYALGLLEKNFDANPSDLIYWPDECRSPTLFFKVPNDQGTRCATCSISYKRSISHSSIGNREGIMIKFVGFVAKAHA